MEPLAQSLALSLLIPFAAIPLVILSSRMSKRAAESLAIAAGLITLGFTLTTAYFYYGELHERPYVIVDYTPYNYPFFQVPLFATKFLLDPLSILMAIIVSFISSLVLIYSKGYMHGDKRLIRYYVFLLLFTGGMLILVLGGNFYLLYIGWEIVGICSCMLIGHWYERPEASKAGIKAFITTRLGDVFFLAAICLIALHLGSLDFLYFAKHAHTLGALLTLILLLSFGGSIGKSAQLPLHVWLKAAMEGPTTVSCLLHSATMVKAGVYLIARLETLVFFYPRILGAEVVEATLLSQFFTVVALVGAITSFIAATMALVTFDLKAVLAFSTISQLGYMFSVLGLAGFIAEEWEAWYAGVFHLESHALFKALLFLCAGSVIHAVESRDMRHMGGLKKYMPITYVTMVVGALSLAGVPPFNGFFSKDLILEIASLSGQSVVSLLLTVTAFLTAAYAFRMIYLTFLAPESEQVKKHKPHESPVVMTGPLIILTLGAVLSGVIEEGLHPLKHLIAESYQIEHSHSGAFNILVPATSVALIALAFGIVYIVYFARKLPPESIVSHPAIKPIYTLLFNEYYFDYVYEQIIVRGFVKIVSTTAWYVEKALNLVQIGGSIALAKVLCAVSYVVDRSLDSLNYVIARGAVFLGNTIRRIHTGKLSSFMIYTFSGLIVLVIIVLLVIMGV